jgi:hypothetical protein
VVLSGILDPLVHAYTNDAYTNDTPKRHLLASNRVVRAIMHVCATLSSTATRLREQKSFKKKKNNK